MAVANRSAVGENYIAETHAAKRISATGIAIRRRAILAIVTETTPVKAHVMTAAT
jgi:hypothetical protein